MASRSSTRRVGTSRPHDPPLAPGGGGRQPDAIRDRGRFRHHGGAARGREHRGRAARQYARDRRHAARARDGARAGLGRAPQPRRHPGDAAPRPFRHQGGGRLCRRAARRRGAGRLVGSHHVRSARAAMVDQGPRRHGPTGGRGVATFGLLFTILGTTRVRPSATPASVALFITAAYWFTSSTSLASVPSPAWRRRKRRACSGCSAPRPGSSTLPTCRFPTRSPATTIRRFTRCGTMPSGRREWCGAARSAMARSPAS